jgi:hypothetical protein
MALLTTSYDPTAAVQVLVQAMEAGKRRQMEEQRITAGLAKAISDDRRNALEWDRLQAFNEAKNAEENARYAAKFAEDRYRDRRDNAPINLGGGSTPATSAAIESVEPDLPQTFAAPSLDASGTSEPEAAEEVLDFPAVAGVEPLTRDIITGEENPGGFAETLATRRAGQFKQGMSALESMGPDSNEMAQIEQQLAQAMAPAPPVQLQQGLGQYAPPSLEQGAVGLPLAGVRPIDPFKPEPNTTPTPPIDGGVLPPISPGGADGVNPGALTQNFGPVERVEDFVKTLTERGIPVRRKDLPGIVQSAFTAAGRGSGGKPPPMSMQQTIAQFGLTPNPESGTYKNREGMEFFVGQGVNGGVSLTPKRPKESSERIINSGGNVWLVPPGGGEPRKIISKEVSDTLPNTVAMRYATALAAQESGRANLDESTRVWETRKAEKKPDPDELADLEKEVQKRQAALRTADATVKSIRQQYPKLGEGEPSEAPADAVTNPDEKAATLAKAKESMGRVNDNGKAKIRERLLASGFVEQELQAAGL